MKQYFLGVLFLFLLLGGCAGSQHQQSLIIQGEKVVVPNPPSLILEFPFEVFLINEGPLNDDDFKRYVYILNTFDIKDDEKMAKWSLDNAKGEFPDIPSYTIMISREEILGNKFYTRNKSPLGDNIIFHDSNQSGECAVIIEDVNLQSSLSGKMIKYISDNQAYRVRIFERIGYVSSPSDWIKNNPNKVKSFTANVKRICDQLIN